MVEHGKHGGKRDNAGRKPREDGKARTIPKSIKVSQEVAYYLAEVGTGIIEDAIRKSKSFRNWKDNADRNTAGENETK